MVAGSTSFSHQSYLIKYPTFSLIRYVVNPSGGLISKGHPLGATGYPPDQLFSLPPYSPGLAQCTELVAQVRGEAAARQVDGATIALQHNLGLGGAVVVALYRLGFPGFVRKATAKL